MMMEFFVFGLFLSLLDPKCWTWLKSFECWHYYDDIIQSTNCKLQHFGFETSRFRNFSMFSYGIGFKNFWYRKKYRYRFRKFLVSKKVSVSVSKNFGIEKSIGIGFGNFWYRKKYRYWFRNKIVLKRIWISFEKN